MSNYPYDPDAQFYFDLDAEGLPIEILERGSQRTTVAVRVYLFDHKKTRAHRCFNAKQRAFQIVETLNHPATPQPNQPIEPNSRVAAWWSTVRHWWAA